MEHMHYGQQSTDPMKIFTGETARNISVVDILDWMETAQSTKTIISRPVSKRWETLLQLYVQNHYWEIIGGKLRLEPLGAEEENLLEMYMERLHLIPGNYKERMYNRPSHFEWLRRQNDSEYRERRESFAMLVDMAISAGNAQQFALLFGFSEKQKQELEHILEYKTNEGGWKYLYREVEKIDPTLFCRDLEADGDTTSVEA